jgi:hypothetical protein
VTEVLRSIPKEAFADSFQKLYERCQQCVVKDGDYFKTNKVNFFVSSVLFVFWYHSPNFLDTPRILRFRRTLVQSIHIKRFLRYSNAVDYAQEFKKITRKDCGNRTIVSRTSLGRIQGSVRKANLNVVMLGCSSIAENNIFPARDQNLKVFTI